MTLSLRYALASLFVLLIGASVIGLWLSHKISEGVTHNTAAATALYMDSFVAPLIQELAVKDRLSDENSTKLAALLKDTAIGKRVISMKIWKEGGLIAYSSRPELIGRKFPPTPNLKRAWSGVVAAEYNKLVDEEDSLERAVGKPLLELYSPIRQRYTDRVIAVGEFYQEAGELQKELFNAKLAGWLVVAGVAATMYLILFWIVHGGSRMITEQQLILERRVGELSHLRDRLKLASQRSVDISEKVLRRIGSDLHDGPAQHLAIALLRLDSFEQHIKDAAKSGQDEHANFIRIKESLTDALSETRNISAGLALPELEGLSISQILSKAVDAHMRRTGMDVRFNSSKLPDKLRQSIKICLFRVVQEALNNSFSHAGANDATVAAHSDGHVIEVTISDKGPGFDPSSMATASEGLGLPGLRERIESLGGKFYLVSAPGKGTSVTAKFTLAN